MTRERREGKEGRKSDQGEEGGERRERVTRERERVAWAVPPDEAQSHFSLIPTLLGGQGRSDLQ